MGVLISWLIFARKTLLALEFDSAISLKDAASLNDLLIK
jgi:hypothetical protein